MHLTTSLMLAAVGNPICAARTVCVCIPMLLATGADPNAAFVWGNTLPCSCRTAHVVEQLLSAPGIKVDAPNKSGCTPLAAQHGHANVVSLLVASGADVNAVEKLA